MSESQKLDDQLLDEINRLDEDIGKRHAEIRQATSEETRKARRNLLIASLMGLGIAMTGAIPNGIVALGINFGTIDRIAFLVLLMLVIMYFVYSFIAYTAEDELHLKLLKFKQKEVTERRLEKLKQLSDPQRLLIPDFRWRHRPRPAIAWFVFPLYSLFGRTGVPVRVIAKIEKVLGFHNYAFPISVAGLSLLALLVRIVIGFPPSRTI
jgi:hypothetical protein